MSAYCHIHHTNNCIECALARQTAQIIEAINAPSRGDALPHIEQPQPHRKQSLRRWLFNQPRLWPSAPPAPGVYRPDQFTRTTTKGASAMGKEFKFEMGSNVATTMSGECGKVVGRAEYQMADNSYYVRMVGADGRQADVWLDESALIAAK